MVVMFFVIAVVLFPFGVGPEANILARIAAGVIWVAALLASMLSLERLFDADYEDGSLEILILQPITLEIAVAAKVTAHWLTTGLPLGIAAPVLGITLALPEEAFGWLFLSLLVGTPALSFIGIVGAALTVGIRRGGLLLSILVPPLYVPTLIFGAHTAADAAKGLDPMPAFMLLAGVSLFTIALAPFVSAITIRHQIR